MSKILSLKTPKGTARLVITDDDLQQIEKVVHTTDEEKSKVFDEIIDKFLAQALQQGVQVERNTLIMALAENLVSSAPTCKAEARQQKLLKEKIVSDRVVACSGHIKMIFGCINNLVLFNAYEAIGRVRQSPRYNHQVRRELRRVMKDIKDYERELVYGPRQWFCIKTMPEKTRKLYGDITDSNYYDYWSALGSEMSELCKDELNVLQDKFKRTMEAHKVTDAPMMSRMMLVCSLFDCAQVIYEKTIGEFAQASRLSHAIASSIWSAFNLARLKKSWERAMISLSIKGQEYDLDDNEQRNLELTLDQLIDKLNDAETYFYATINNTEDWEDIFRTKGTHKKALREIAKDMDSCLNS